MTDINRSWYSANFWRTSVICQPVEALEKRVFLSAAAPAVVDSQFLFDAFPTEQTISITFNENVKNSLEQRNFTLQNLTTGAAVPQGNLQVHFDDNTNVASITFDGGEGLRGDSNSHIFPDGNYRLTLPAGSVQDEAGSPLASDFTLDFFVLAGDANRDRAVDVSDLGILATNWQREDRTFSRGDFNYDGKVDVSDLGILATNWQKSLPPPVAGAESSMRLAPQPSAPVLAPAIGNTSSDPSKVIDQIGEI